MKKKLYYIFLGILLVASLFFYLYTKYPVRKFIAKLLLPVTVKIEDTISIWENKLHPTSGIDLVYTWVDGSDKSWQKEKAYWAKKYGVEYNIENDDSKFRDNDELKYSLRSVEMYAPWVHKIYIVTNGQVPKWLNTNHPKIKIITHDQIMPKDALPTFNSVAIEANLAHIPDLSEKFLYSNDDTFLGRPVAPSFFFNKDGKFKILQRRISRSKFGESQHYKMIIYSLDVFKRKYNLSDFMEKPVERVHQITPYLKSDYLNCEKDFLDEFNKVTRAKFRRDDIIQSHIITYYSLKNKNARFLSKKPSDEVFIDYTKIKYIDKIIKSRHPKLMCFNDDEKATPEDALAFKRALEKLWPQKSSFEK